MRKPILYVIGSLFVVAAIAGLSSSLLVHGTSKEATTGVEPGIPVSIEEVVAGEVPANLTGVGTLEAVQHVNISPEVGGRVVELNFRSGQTIKAGDVLLRLNADPERGDLMKFTAQTKNARLILERTNKTLAALTLAELDQAQANFDQSQGETRRTRALIEQKTVRAPFDGVLGIRKANLGQYLNPGDAIVTLTSLSSLFVNFPLPEQMSAQIHVGQTIKISVDAYPDRTFGGVVSSIEPQVNSSARSIQIQATVDNTERLLKPGMFADVDVALPPHRDVLTVPETAVTYTTYGTSVFVLRENKGGQLHVEQQRIKTGPRSNSRVIVLNGLSAHDRVVTSGQINLSNGAAVYVKKDASVASSNVGCDETCHRRKD
ncbi:putative Co/Zn/Cd efflux system membrane fusion protein [Paraburkholderia caribensis MBA4]|uniref:Putative Co/Zn/Cd efflux system membrane fusion protein n=1 Tax=Paraburkholderia caribensis MBA4 TaxID=1323664 RepID=A0A0P0RGK8_9BURK|nr:efflux RND transporter periplasmic adaptor subunit [Paraburkholderia caribensis]ALL67617.1 putative Co/Zn/Cd efflux system membrane fusion protein [Paraburkholderia caribensis MBA4]